jgi:hypothetical protein
VHVFISHSSRDRWIALQVDRAIHEAGGQTFLDEKDLQAGDRIRERVKAGLKACDEFVVILSSASQLSDWVKGEIGAAWALDKRIVILLDKLSPRDVPDIVADYKAYDLNDVERYVAELRTRIEGTRP